MQLNEQVKRNLGRFPKDFMFRLTRHEVGQLNWSQIATSSQKHRDPRYQPYVFTEHGTVMLANILKSKTAVLARKMNALEKKYDAQFKVVFDAIRQLIRPVKILGDKQ